MCIAAVIFKPISMAYLQEMENDNPHGGGVAWEENGAIHFSRGLTAKEIFRMQETEEMTYPYLLHFRWATHGDKVAQLTHPFPVGPRALLGETEGFANEVVIHNGTWSGYSGACPTFSEFPDELLGEMSDTAIAAWLAAENPDVLDDVPWATAHAYMRDGTMDITTRGTWYEKEGCWYSNLNWVPSNYMGRYSSPYAGMSDDYVERWTKWYESEKTEHSGAYRVPSDEDIERQTQASTEGMTWEQYCEKYGTPYTPEHEQRKAALSWREYLVSRYGEDVAKEINDSLLPEPEADDCGPLAASKESPVYTDNLTRSYGYAWESCCEAPEVDPDAVSEDFETVNEAIRKQMEKAS